MTLHFYFLFCVCIFKFEFFKYSVVVNVKGFSYNFCFSLVSWSEEYRQYSDLLWAGQSGDQNSVGAHPAGSLSPGVKWPGHHIDHLPQSSVEVKERVEL